MRLLSFLFFAIERRRRQRQQLYIEEEEDDNCRHLLQWLCYKEMATSAFLCGFAAKKGTATMVADFYFLFFLLLMV
jgi:hypothetical protein